MAKIGFIGMGNMGYAMLKGIINKFDKDDIIFTDVNKERVLKVSEELGIPYAESNAECANSAKYVILAVKPQFYSQVIKNIQNVVQKDHVIISIAPGITIQSLKDSLGFDSRIVRAMPNTPALIGEGMSGVFGGEFVNTEDITYVYNLFSSIGKAVVLDNSQLQ